MHRISSVASEPFAYSLHLAFCVCFFFLLLLYRYISARFVAFDLKRIVDYDEGNQAIHSHSNLDAHIHISIMNVFISKTGHI